jgi:ribose transport system ATP-binding protein
MANRDLTEHFPKVRATLGPELLRLEHVSRQGALSDISLSLRAGEVVGIAGLAGAGRSELVETIFGVRTQDSGTVVVNGERLDASRPDRAVSQGLGLLGEDRKKTGLCLNLSLAQNLTLAKVRSVGKGWRLDRKRETAVAGDYIKKLDIRPPDPAKTIGQMSGGNQQKVLVARWLFANSKVFLLDEPTRGVDVTSRGEIYRAINEMAEAGAAVVIVSSDLPELLGIADRILVMRRGRLVADLDPKLSTEEEILRHAAVGE